MRSKNKPPPHHPKYPQYNNETSLTPFPLGHAQYHVAPPSHKHVKSNNAPAPPEVSSTQRRCYTDPLSFRSRIHSYLLDQASNHMQLESPPRIPNKTTYVAVPQILIIHNTFVFPKYDTFLRPVAPRLSTICLLAAVYKFRILSLSLSTTHFLPYLSSMTSAVMSFILPSNQPSGSLLNHSSTSPTSPTFQASFPVPHAPDNFSQATNMPMTSFPTFSNVSLLFPSLNLSQRLF